ncbi:hypothetical protein [Tuwongella immobilis]|uniref:Glutamine amidotransferase domain-containing protein n=1 Tax=Tuwongella immobilis TaxID=692036 RepID=A0A6C2YM95_9BACT|nr:hypothetical protein [Tuwongella immobilis]VIP02556.1 Uncharacterized membrane protein OS=Chthonomonas calidirosea (strain DSM 23976 / ICMP 18418 / T49) GN=CCALI_02531 PE=4 SV=1: DUF1355 [Tuwongella immobilis]VTS01757.1 Uncharacterized membrane protein OS=Chthonomonas calidirosea (strain DSM 23976 / ICMP 18418 / T49) GN=CCALI_02531 PE=4 SV=1: DUF1355 [Tuwongella immobilis]
MIVASFTLDSFVSPWPWLLAIVAIAAILVATYAGIVRRSGRRIGWMLLGLRSFGILLLLLALAKPTWTTTREVVEPGRLAVIVDDSQSMSLTDTGTTSRFEQATTAAQSLQTLAEQKFGSKLMLDWYDIQGRKIDGALPTEAKAERTDLGRAVREVASKARSQPLAGIALISDGMDTVGRSDFQDLGNLPVPVYAMLFPLQTDSGTLDLAMRKLPVPPRALVNNEIPIQVPLLKVGGSAVTATVSLHRGTEVVATQEVAMPAGNADQLVTIRWTPTQPGTFRLTARVAANQPEPVLTNNAEAVDVQVDGEPIRIVYLEGGLRWESRYLLDHLRNDPDIRLETLLRVVNPERAATKLPETLTPERLAQTDIVILGDVEAKFLSDAEQSALLAWLDGKNHALLTLGGYRSFGAEGWATSKLAGVMPVNLPRSEPFQREGRFSLTLTDDGRRHPAFALSDDRTADAETWTQQGELEGISLVGTAKPGATVLAVHPGLSVENAPAVVAAWQPIGAGSKSVLFTGDTTWRWSRLPRLIGRNDTLYSRFWSQMLRWMAGRDGDDTRPLLRVATDRVGYEPGKPVAVTVSRMPRSGNDLSDSQVAVEIRSPDGKPMPLTVQNSSANPDEFTAQFTPTNGGRFQVGATLTAAGKLLANADTEILVQSSALELADPRTNPANLEAIARLTRGKAVPISDPAALVNELAPRERRTMQVSRAEFWNSPVLFLGFLVAVTVEWLIRRRNHMV